MSIRGSRRKESADAKVRMVLQFSDIVSTMQRQNGMKIGIRGDLYLHNSLDISAMLHGDNLGLEKRNGRWYLTDR